MNRRRVHLGITLLIIGALALSLSLLVHPYSVLAQDDAAATVDEVTNTWPTYSENFSRANDLWEIDEESADSGLSFADGAYEVFVGEPTLFAWGLADAAADDLYVEVDSVRAGGPEDNEFGIVFRHVDTENFYAYMISSDGFYTLRKHENGEWADILPWAESDQIVQGEGATNRIGVLADGPAITLFVNGEVAGEVEDSTFASGEVGLAAGSFDESGVAISFDDFSMWDLALAGGEVVVTPDVTETPTEEPPVVMEPMPPLPEGDPDFTDEFRSDTGEWETEPTDSVTFEIRGREFTLAVDDPNAVGWSPWSVSDGASDYVFQVDATLVAGPEMSEYGIMFRVADNQNFYFYAVQPDGTYSLWKLVNNEWSEIIPWTASDVILTGFDAVNRLGVQTQGSTFWLLANDEVVGQAEDDSIASGKVAVSIGSFDEAGVEAVFDNADLWLLADVVVPVETPEPEVTPEAESTPEVVVTPISDEVRARLDEVRTADATTVDEFRRDSGDWSATSGESARFFYEARALHERIDAVNWTEWSTNENYRLADFLAEIDVAHVEGPENAQQGLLFRFVDGENFYFFAISANGYYMLLKRANGEWQTLVDWTESPAMNAGVGAVNRIGVLAEGDDLTLLVNGEPVEQLTDDGMSEGALGVAAGTFDTGGLEIAFDNLSVWDLAEQ